MKGGFRRRVVIFAKEPRLRRVKTRLGRDIGHVDALMFYRRMLFSLTRRLSSDPRWETLIACAPDTSVSDGGVWPEGVQRIGQGPGDLGARMQRTFDRLPPGPVVIVGADIPGIENADIADAFEILGRHDAVFGPAEDGGYWLVGQKRRPRVIDMFGGVRWSGPHALEHTLSNLKGARHGMLRPLSDVDDGADYARLIDKS